MTCRRLSSLALMNIHYSHPVNYDTAVEIFLKTDAPKKNRTIQSTYGVGIVHAQSNHSVSVINLFAQ